MTRRNRYDVTGSLCTWWRGMTFYRTYWRGPHLMVRLTPAWKRMPDRWFVFPRDLVPCLSKEEFQAMASKFMPPKFTGNGHSSPLGDALFREKYPLLASWLGDSVWGDGKTPRTPSTLIVCVKGGQFSAGLINKDSDPESSLWCQASSFHDALAGMEELLNDPRAPWQSKGLYNGSVKGRRK